MPKLTNLNKFLSKIIKNYLTRQGIAQPKSQ
jgi:hypothetical protein